MARLQAAVHNVPGHEPQQEATPAPESAADKPRFGINSLINRMTGHGEAAADAKPEPVRQQPPVQSPAVEADIDPEQERVEIPAFLRRQAN